jgi:phosphatidylglycerol:prolipoprotein diacylglycerol transferase
MFPRLFTIPSFELFGRELGPLTMPTYGLILILGFMAGLWFVARESRRLGLDPAAMTDLAIYVLIGGLVGAKLLLLVVDFRFYLQNPGELLSILRSGGVFYGGLLGGLGVGAWYIWKHNLALWQTADVLAPALVLGQAIGRFACLAAGCCWGRPTQVAWAVTFRDIYAFRTVGTPVDTPLHPSQIYESFAAAAIFVVLVWLAPRKRFHGQVALGYFVLYSAARFGLEYYRGDASRGFVLGGLFSTSQFIALCLILMSVLLFPYLRRKYRVEPAA